ncbi:hypothetical protein ACSNOI_43210 [Actinomadura kijaniata]|uniref:hypothetical protein n=1 Tax=Actinomadura kijaniata TaxID=46161 RepID=UPI003F1BC690
MIELLFLGSAAFAGGVHAVRRSRPAAPRVARRAPRTESLVVKAWKSAGAPHTEETMLADAVADLGGRAVGKMARSARNRGRRMRPWAEARWQRRRADDGAAFFIRRRHTQSTRASAGTGPAGAAGTAPPTPHGTTSPKVVQGRAVPQLPAGGTGGAAPAVPPGPIPMPAAGPSPARPAPAPSAGRGQARPRRGRRARARMRIAGPMNLEVPQTDAEFLETCQELQQLLRGVGVAVEDWTDQVTARRLPPIITGPLMNVHEGLVDAAACTALAGVLFEAWFAEARAVAASGIHFTGDDPE